MAPGSGTYFRYGGQETPAGEGINKASKGAIKSSEAPHKRRGRSGENQFMTYAHPAESKALGWEVWTV